MADDVLIKTEQNRLSQQYDRNDIKHCSKYNFLTCADDDKNFLAS